MIGRSRLLAVGLNRPVRCDLGVSAKPGHCSESFVLDRRREREEVSIRMKMPRVKAVDMEKGEEQEEEREGGSGERQAYICKNVSPSGELDQACTSGYVHLPLDG